MPPATIISKILLPFRFCMRIICLIEPAKAMRANAPQTGGSFVFGGVNE
jgi:hypothetical protein